MENKINKTNKGPAPFEFPTEAADALASANITTVGLPFETYVWFVKNGRPAAKQMGGISYTGGFACSSIPEANYKLMDVFGETHDLSAIFEPLTNTNVNSQGVEYNTVDLPSLIVTPVLYRKRFSSFPAEFLPAFRKSRLSSGLCFQRKVTNPAQC